MRVWSQWKHLNVGKYVHNIRAIDSDEKPLLRYRISPENSEARNEEGTIVKSSEYDYVHMFDLDPKEGHLRVVKLIDRERVETIRLGLVVEDLAAIKKKQVTTAMLTIIIEDENDNNPKFRRPFYRRSITENSKNGVTIINVVADDADKNRTIKYALEDIKYSGRSGVLSMDQGSALFSSRWSCFTGRNRGDGQELILKLGVLKEPDVLHPQRPNPRPRDILSLIYLDEETGEVVVANKIDHEVFPWLNFTVQATDSGIPPRSSFVDNFIQVLDENDNNPYFVGDVNNITVREDAPLGDPTRFTNPGTLGSSGSTPIQALMCHTVSGWVASTFEENWSGHLHEIPTGKLRNHPKRASSLSYPVITETNVRHGVTGPLIAHYAREAKP
uniref:Cadherin domain-containing protein n=1 Tax=Timema bartmani TaxID=61472 RepID=A0A7R9EXH3_9NEOP|nr:unnamed protein product [Timema bartmani]